MFPHGRLFPIHRSSFLLHAIAGVPSAALLKRAPTSFTLTLSTADFRVRNGRTPTGLPCPNLRELPDTPPIKQQAEQEAERGGKLTRRAHKPPPGLDGAVFTRSNLLAASSEH